MARFSIPVLSGYFARRRYFVADRWARAALYTVATSPDPSDRAFALWDLVDADRVMAENAHGFRNHHVRDQEGFTLAASIDLGARLLARVAGTEAMLAWHDVPGPMEYGTALPVGDTAEAVLAKLAIEPHPVVRANLVLALHDAVVGLVGGQAAEPLAAVAACYLELVGMPRAAIRRRVWPQRGESR